MALDMKNYEPALMYGADLSASVDITVGDDLSVAETIAITAPVAAQNALDITATAITTGKAIDVSDLNALTSGQGIHVASSATAITNAGHLIYSNHTGATSTSGVLNEFASAAADETVIAKVTASGALTGNVLDLSAASLATGKVIDISDLAALTTGKAIHVDATGVTQTDGILVHIDSASTALTATGRLLLVDHTGNAGVSNINSEFKSAAADETVIVQVTASDALAGGKCLFISPAAMTTGTALDISGAVAMTTGSLVNVNDNSADTGTRSVVKITQDHVSATGATALEVKQDSTLAAIKVTAAANTTNYFKIATMNGVTLWMGNGNGANGVLTATAGDILFNGASNKPEYCTGTNVWVALV